MSYDRIWIQCVEHREHFHERSEAEEEGLLEEFTTQFDRQYAQGYFVVLSAGKNCSLEELFLFEDASDAGAFYESGFKDRELFIGDEAEGCDFQEVSLYRGGHLAATKSCAPTKRIEVQHE
jgi:hypothetical protein